MFARSIPACAGEPPSRTLRSTLLNWGLSPRVRGNHSLHGCNPPNHRSIPACAGNRQDPAARILEFRSIPACAGEPTSCSPVSEWIPVYPRVCGGTSVSVQAASLAVGLSPRVRGNPENPLDPGSLQRSIPACAGEPSRRSEIGTPNTVYPRVCGGTKFHLYQRQITLGLSPRVRGNRTGGCEQEG